MRVFSNNELGKFLKSPYKEIWEIGNATGLRITDILNLKYKQLLTEKPTIKEQKTGKSKRIYIPKKTRTKLLKNMRNKEEYIFKSELSKTGHITRQAVFKAFKKAGEKAKTEYNIGTHTMRKNYALKMKKNHNLKYVQNKLNHDNLTETLLYLMKEE